jgi:hypothetical protein
VWPAVHRNIRSRSRTNPDSVEKFIVWLLWCQSHKRCSFICTVFVAVFGGWRVAK